MVSGRNFNIDNTDDVKKAIKLAKAVTKNMEKERKNNPAWAEYCSKQKKPLLKKCLNWFENLR